MKRSRFAVVTVSVLLAGGGLAWAQTSTSTTTNWTTDDGTAIRVYSASKHYSLFNGPNLKPSVGMELPGAGTPYLLPDTMKVPSTDRYSYSIVDDRPVVVESTTRKVIPPGSNGRIGN